MIEFICQSVGETFACPTIHRQRRVVGWLGHGIGGLGPVGIALSGSRPRIHLFSFHEQTAVSPRGKITVSREMGDVWLAAGRIGGTHHP